MTLPTLILPIILVLVIVLLVGAVVYLWRRTSVGQQRSGERSAARRRQRGDERP